MMSKFTTYSEISILNPQTQYYYQNVKLKLIVPTLASGSKNWPKIVVYQNWAPTNGGVFLWSWSSSWSSWWQIFCGPPVSRLATPAQAPASPEWTRKWPFLGVWCRKLTFRENGVMDMANMLDSGQNSPNTTFPNIFSLISADSADLLKSQKNHILKKKSIFLIENRL